MVKLPQDTFLDQKRLPRERLYYWIYVSSFGVIWALGTGILAGALPPDPLTRTLVITWFETLILVLTKLVLLRRLSVTHAITIAATISIITFSFGPPNPYKPLFLFAGLAFDAGTFFRTNDLRFWNMIGGFVLYVPAIYAVFALVLWLIDPTIMETFWPVIPFAAAVYLAEGVIISAIIWPFINPKRAPSFVMRIRARIART